MHGADDDLPIEDLASFHDEVEDFLSTQGRVTQARMSGDYAHLLVGEINAEEYARRRAERFPAPRGRPPAMRANELARRDLHEAQEEELRRAYDRAHAAAVVARRRTTVRMATDCSSRWVRRVVLGLHVIAVLMVVAGTAQLLDRRGGLGPESHAPVGLLLAVLILTGAWTFMLIRDRLSAGFSAGVVVAVVLAAASLGWSARDLGVDGGSRPLEPRTSETAGTTISTALVSSDDRRTTVRRRADLRSAGERDTADDRRRALAVPRKSSSHRTVRTVAPHAAADRRSASAPTVPPPADRQSGVGSVANSPSGTANAGDPGVDGTRRSKAELPSTSTSSVPSTPGSSSTAAAGGSALSSAGGTSAPVTTAAVAPPVGNEVNGGATAG